MQPLPNLWSCQEQTEKLIRQDQLVVFRFGKQDSLLECLPSKINMVSESKLLLQHMKRTRNYKMAEKTPQQHYENNMTTNAIVTL
jgi:hypothetical protein